MHPYSYATAFRRATQRACESLKRIELDHQHAPDQLVELLALSPPERERALESKSRFHNYSLATHALRRCEQELFCDPFKARELARMARSFAGHIDPKTCGGDEALTDLKADALAVEANALRVQGDFRMSLKVFAKARVTQQRGASSLT